MARRPIKKWTILMQVSAENNLFTDMLRVMEELYSIRENGENGFEEVNFLVLFDGLEAKKFSYDFSRPALYLVRPGTSFFIEYPEYILRNEDMTDPNNLKNIYQFVKDNFPARKFGFIYKGHGSHGEGDIGSTIFKERIMKVPVSYEETTNYGKLDRKINLKAKYFKGWKVMDYYRISGFRSLNLEEVYFMVILGKRGGKTLTYRVMAQQLIKVFGENKLDFLFLDCCWGMQIENAYSFRNIAKYFIASADLMPAAGVGYSDFLKKLIERPTIKEREIANILLSVFFTNKYDDYDNEEDASFRKMGVSLTNMKMDELDNCLTVFNELCEYLGADIGKFAPLVKKVRDCCEDHTYSAVAVDFNMFNIDLVWFLENLLYFNQKFTKDQGLSNLTLQLLYLVTVRLRFGFMGNNYKKLKPGTRAIGGNGITITFPENQVEYRGSMFYKKNGINPEFITDTEWRPFLSAYYKHISSVLKNKKPGNEYIQRVREDRALARMMGIRGVSDREIRSGIHKFFKTAME